MTNGIMVKDILHQISRSLERCAEGVAQEDQNRSSDESYKETYINNLNSIMVKVITLEVELRKTLNYMR